MVKYRSGHSVIKNGSIQQIRYDFLSLCHVSIAGTIFETYDNEEYHDFEIKVRGHSPCKLMPMTHAAETRTRKPVPVFCRCIMWIGIDFFWYGVGQCSNPCRKPVITWQKNDEYWLVRQSPAVLFIVVLFVVFTFYCFKMNWGDSNIENLIKVYSDNSFLFEIADADYHNRVKRLCTWRPWQWSWEQQVLSLTVY